MPRDFLRPDAKETDLIISKPPRDKITHSGGIEKFFGEKTAYGSLDDLANRIGNVVITVAVLRIR
jgi:hypothetical protein